MTHRPTFLLAPDSFKESLTARQVCEALEAGLREVFPDATYVHVPMADGGEGTLQSLVDATGGEVSTLTVEGPTGTPVEARYAILGDGSTAVVEMASASGLALVAPGVRDPRTASSYGTGQLVAACLDRGATRLVLGLGGSATNDAGAGFARALGVRFLDADGAELPPGGAALARLATIDTSGLDPRLDALRIDVACDVTNPLCGPEGASAVYGPQKGADAATVAELDAALARFAEVVLSDLGRDVRETPGAGAAGGLGAGLLAFTHGELRRGVDIVIEYTGLEGRVADADVVITGEGRIDAQTRFGKTPHGVARVARAAGKPVIALAGSLGDGSEALHGEVFDAILPIIGHLDTLEGTLAAAGENLRRTARTVGVLLRLGALLPPSATPRP